MVSGPLRILVLHLSGALVQVHHFPGSCYTESLNAHNQKQRMPLVCPFPSGSLSIPRPSGNALWNGYWPLIFTFCGLMNCIDDVTSLIKQRLAEGSILFLKTIKVFIELGFHLCKLCLEVFFFFLSVCFFFLFLYNTVLVLPYINMNPPRVYMSSQS